VIYFNISTWIYREPAFTGKVQFGGEQPILQALGTVFAFCDCVISLLTRILPYIGFTFDVPEHQSYPLSSVLYYTVPVTVPQA
jgi:hypothetical protein